ncbi:superoxide dismutase family protein [Bdellovibrio bacteriovorus]|uniref:superoxide dismutase family protein n=1 Tax=Bdellovibrio bacteriovorus TaxID=959 RepID=UPI0035A66069
MKNKIIAGFAVLSLSACAQFQRGTENKTAGGTSEPTATTAQAPTRAQAVLKSASTAKVKGIIHFTEEDGRMKVETMVEGLKPGPHGFHIHETGDCSASDFTSAGGHFNPHASNHGSLTSDKRHVGDFGNLMADNKGKANTALVVQGMTMKPGADSIIGKAVIIHKDKDDLKSQPAGNAGARIACGVIQAL